MAGITNPLMGPCDPSQLQIQSTFLVCLAENVVKDQVCHFTETDQAARAPRAEAAALLLAGFQYSSASRLHMHDVRVRLP